MATTVSISGAEQAIRSFERLHALTITVHDLHGDLAPLLLPERARHRHPLCSAFKNSGHERHCVAFDVITVRRDLAYAPDGRIQRCPAGLVEWVVPALDQEGLRWVLFAGVAAAEPLGDLVTARAREAVPFAPRAPARDPVQAEALLEALRQLRARLVDWIDARARPSARAAGGTESAQPRRAKILRFIHERHAHECSLDDLARHLGLSRARASSATRRACGAGFQELLGEARLRSAVDLLRHTDLPVADIATNCGFGDLSNFFRAFRKRHGTTPLRFRHAQAGRTGWSEGV